MFRSRSARRLIRIVFTAVGLINIVAGWFVLPSANLPPSFLITNSGFGLGMARLSVLTLRGG
jgi:hypothetical protein